jgi:hypothetical protein
VRRKVKSQKAKVESARESRRSPKREGGQTFTEYVMILGLLTAIIVGLTGIIVPGLGQAVVGLVNYMVLFLGTPSS